MALLLDCAATRVADAPLAAWAREMLVNYTDDESPGDPDWGTQNTLSKRAVVHACGCFSRSENAAGAHAHEPGELALAQRVAAELGTALTDVDVGQGDESDHALAPFYAAAQAPRDGDPRLPPHATALDEARLRDHAFGGALDPRYPLRLRPFPPDSFDAFRRDVLRVDDSMLESEPSWVADGGGDGAASLLGWRAAFAWFTSDQCFLQFD